VIEAIQRETGERPVFTRGDLWCYEDGIWCARSLDSIGMTVAERFAGGKYCKRGSDFASIANVGAKLCEDERFFECAAVGIAAPGGFWRVTATGEIQCEPLTAAHRHRMRVAADPDLQAEPMLLLKVLRDAFAGKEPDEQIRLVQQLFGCAVTRSLWRHRVVALFLGATNSGKSTLLTLLSSVFPQDQLGACGPQRWGNEYYVAALAGVAVNVVGDLDKKEPIPGYFKNVVGRDLIQGRHPTHRPFTFVCEASHFFNSNHCPPTADHSDAFFNRWRIVHFARSVPLKDRDRDLDKRLIETETGAMLGWALRGAADVAKAGRIAETATHEKLLQKWRVANNSALAFLFDEQECKLAAEASTPGQELYKAYRTWAQENGMKPFGRNGFYEALTEGAGEARIEVVPRESSADHQVHVRGVRLGGF
jgi:P4 family phage/plasmid primase-like protien